MLVPCSVLLPERFGFRLAPSAPIQDEILQSFLPLRSAKSIQEASTETFFNSLNIITPFLNIVKSEFKKDERI